MGMKHWLANEGVPFINMFFQHAVLFLLHLMLHAMMFRRLFEYSLVLMGCKLNSCLSLLYLGISASVLTLLLFLGMWSQQQILSHPFYPSSFLVIMWLFFKFWCNLAISEFICRQMCQYNVGSTAYNVSYYREKLCVKKLIHHRTFGDLWKAQSLAVWVGQIKWLR